ncbi:MAG: rhodanese-like domain-containing protein, partial [Flavobacteriales bacterium]|nr:rhodanese-like domain-containing protein [Flavobacteriales bacterium]
MAKWMLLVGTISSALSACTQGNFDKMVKRTVDPKVDYVYADSLNQMTDVIYLDAREQKEYDVSHIEDAICVGYDTFDMASVANLDKSKPIVVYCSIGYRSNEVAAKLEEAGFENVYNLYGGIFQWTNDGREVYYADGQTNDV